jgi:hypothetical protein
MVSPEHFTCLVRREFTNIEKIYKFLIMFYDLNTLKIKVEE